MPTLTMSISGSTIVNGSKNWQLSDADLQRILDFMKSKPDIPPNLTNAQLLLNWVTEFINGTNQQVQQYEIFVKQQAAPSSTPPVVFT